MKKAAQDGKQATHLRICYTEAESSTSSTHRAFIHPSTLRAYGATAGAPIAIALEGESSLDECIVVLDAWPGTSLEHDQVCLPQYLATESFSKATVVRLAETLPRAINISVSTIQQQDVRLDKTLAVAHVRNALLSRKYVSRAQRIHLAIEDKEHSFVIDEIKCDGTGAATTQELPSLRLQKRLQDLAVITRSSAIAIQPQTSTQQHAKHDDHLINGVLAKEAAYATLGGLDAQIEELRQLVELPLRSPEIFIRYGLRPPRGLLLFGPPGTGKTTLAYSAAKACVLPSSIFTISGPELSSSLHGGTERALRKLFHKARMASPSVIIIDEIDALAPRRDGDSADGSGEVEKRVVATLLTLMDGIGNVDGARVVVIAATNRPNALDPALRRPGRLDKEVEVGIPSSAARLSILRVLLKGVPHTLTNEELGGVAAGTHGYVGADLSSLVREAGMHAIQRAYTSTASNGLQDQMSHLTLREEEVHANTSESGLTVADFAFAQTRIRPSAMREVTLEMPKVSWNDIAPGKGGQEVQQRVRECVEWPLKYRSTMKALGIDAPRGVLLYGPPGCSKTLIARALASESGLNFVAVKGPELLNKFVGESERALREVFRKARAASPSIIFFDEIDGMTTTRGADAGGAGDKLIATLLNEMDGVEQLSNVLVVAATNRPDVLDPALLRPGRLDRLLYVGPPDYEARRQILHIRARQMSVSDDVDFDSIAQQVCFEMLKRKEREAATDQTPLGPPHHQLDGCSGAEVVSVCQDAGLRAMNEDVHARCVRKAHFAAAASAVRRRITTQMLRKYEAWRDQASL